MRCLGMGNTGKGVRKAARGKHAQDHLNLENKDRDLGFFKILSRANRHCRFSEQRSDTIKLESQNNYSL